MRVELTTTLTCPVEPRFPSCSCILHGEEKLHNDLHTLSLSMATTWQSAGVSGLLQNWSKIFLDCLFNVNTDCCSPSKTLLHGSNQTIR